MTTKLLPRSPAACTAARPACAAMWCGAVVFLAACGTTSPTRHYAVEGTPAARPAVAYRGPAIQVRELRIPATMDRPELVSERVGGEVQLREFDRWAAPLERNARQALTQSLAARLPAGAVVLAGAARPAERIDLSVEVLALRIADGDASMWVAWGAQRVPAAAPAPGVAASAASAPMAASQLRLHTPASDDAAATAKAWSVLLGQLADRIATEMLAGQ